MRKLLAFASLPLLLVACTPKQYEICDTPGCGDNVIIVIEDDTGNNVTGM